jgi:hypothetical protein
LKLQALIPGDETPGQLEVDCGQELWLFTQVEKLLVDLAGLRPAIKFLLVVCSNTRFLHSLVAHYQSTHVGVGRPNSKEPCWSFGCVA